MRDTMDALGISFYDSNGKMKSLSGTLEILVISFGEILVPVIRDVVGWLQGLADWLNGLDEGTKKMIVTIALVAAVVAPGSSHCGVGSY